MQECMVMIILVGANTKSGGSITAQLHHALIGTHALQEAEHTLAKYTMHRLLHMPYRRLIKLTWANVTACAVPTTHDSGRATMHAQIGTCPKGGREYNCNLHHAQIGTVHALQEAEQTVANGTACIGGADDSVRATMHAQTGTGPTGGRADNCKLDSKCGADDSVRATSTRKVNPDIS
jgi:hypothetical protein